jgi:hypothetical protein
MMSLRDEYHEGPRGECHDVRRLRGTNPFVWAGIGSNPFKPE